MKQRLGIADVLVKDPRLVILDEPTTGIDPAGVNQILDLIVSMSRDRGITVMLSSHLLHQVQKVCDRVGILFQGRMVAQGSIDELGREVGGGKQNVIEVQVTEAAPPLCRSLRSIAGVNSVEQVGSNFTITCERDVRQEISRAVVDSGSLPLEVKARDYGLEEIYMKYFREG
jgi:ABC-2 type transport system ATP-binding protein